MTDNASQTQTLIYPSMVSPRWQSSRGQSLLLAAVVGSSWLLFKIWVHLRKRWRLQSAIRARRDEQALNFEKTRIFYEGLSAEKAAEIISYTYPVLKEKLQKGEVSCVDVLRAYQRKAMEVTLSTNCVCLFIEEAIVLAEELDAKVRQSDYKKPALFGVPISIKECVAVKGMDSTLGYVQDLFKPSADHSVVVKTLLHLGAVPFVHTNNPLSLLTWGCTNAVYGSTNHPKDKSRIPGGSSGGEAALLSSGGSILGIGSDIGGSIRIPASFCGLAGFKPSVQRLSHTHSPGGVPGRCKIIATEGPMALHIDTCIDFLRLTWSDSFLFDIDPYVPPVKVSQNQKVNLNQWNEPLFASTKPLTIGWYIHDGYLEPAPAYVRAVKESVRLLEAKGHKLVPFQLPNPEKIFPLLLGSVSADGGYFLNDKMSQDIVPAEVNYGILGRYVSSKIQTMIKPIVPWPRLRNLLGSMPANMREMRKVNADIDSYKSQFLRLMQQKNIDVLLSPTMIMYPPSPDVPVKIPPATNYTSLFNLLDYPAGVCPVTSVLPEDNEQMQHYPKNDPFDKIIKTSSENMENFPIGVQVAALPYKEEIALRILKELQDGFAIKN